MMSSIFCPQVPGQAGGGVILLLDGCLLPPGAAWRGAGDFLPSRSALMVTINALIGQLNRIKFTQRNLHARKI